MTKITPLLLAVLLLSACAGMTSFDQSLRGLKGHPINDARIALKDEPSGTYTDKQGQLVYLFERSKRGSIFGPAVTKGKGFHLAGDRVHSDIYWTGIEHDRCTIRAATRNGIIQNITMDGNPGGCEIVYAGKREELGYDVSQRP